MVTTPMSSSNPTLGSTLTCSASAFDNDNDSVTVSYAVSQLHQQQRGAHRGSLELLASGSTTAGQVVASIGDNVICVVTAMDPSGLTDTDQAIVSIPFDQQHLNHPKLRCLQ